MINSSHCGLLSSEPLGERGTRTNGDRSKMVSPLVCHPVRFSKFSTASSRVSFVRPLEGIAKFLSNKTDALGKARSRQQKKSKQEVVHSALGMLSVRRVSKEDICPVNSDAATSPFWRIRWLEKCWIEEVALNRADIRVKQQLKTCKLIM